ncbi:MAG TPA: hypothetical protein VFN23_13970, partial [Ktedonobacteraceae bacterium]|nr:hypothetical protein [Ktedonobacteraceae bacterium]
MTTRASQNGTIAAEMEFEATHYNSPESEDEWEAHEGHPYNVPESSHYNSPEFEDEWEAHEGHPYNIPESSHFNSPEFEDEWEIHEGHPYNVPESSHYNYPEFENEADRFIPIIAKAATKLLPHAIRFGRNLFRRMGRGRRSPQQSGGRPVATGSRSQQISALFHQLGRLFAQGEMETASHEAHLFGANE